jgi:hypothetical protein
LIQPIKMEKSEILFLYKENRIKFTARYEKKFLDWINDK